VIAETTFRKTKWEVCYRLNSLTALMRVMSKLSKRADLRISFSFLSNFIKYTKIIVKLQVNHNVIFVLS